MIAILCISLAVCTAGYVGSLYGSNLGKQLGFAKGYRKAREDYRRHNLNLERGLN